MIPVGELMQSNHPGYRAFCLGETMQEVYHPVFFDYCVRVCDTFKRHADDHCNGERHPIVSENSLMRVIDCLKAVSETDDPEEPNRPRFKGPIALLIDARCISAGEGWASWFIANKRARVFGEATAGASSRKTIYTLSNSLFKVRYPVKAYRGSLDRPIERRGLEPDVPLRQNAKDLAAGRDTVLQTARRHLLQTE